MRRGWAVAGANPTDWILYFNNSNGKWAVIPTVGTKQTGMQRGCYNGLTLREQGAPERFTRQVPIRTPAEIGKWYFCRNESAPPRLRWGTALD